jgi:hypothetical protein
MNRAATRSPQLTATHHEQWNRRSGSRRELISTGVLERAPATLKQTIGTSESTSLQFRLVYEAGLTH